MDDLQDFDESFETQSMQGRIQKPEQFNEVVDIIVSESRLKAKEKIEKEHKAAVSQNNWMKEINDLGEQQEQRQLVAMPEKKTYESVVESMGGQENEDKPFWA
jgi:hypothetical protein